MNNMTNQIVKKYQLISLKKEHISILYNWNMEERHLDHYTCRPLNICKSFEEYALKILKGIKEGKQKIYLLVKEDTPNLPLGKIALFDLNPRNHSAEFGYYLPKNNRGQGLGNIMISEFIEIYFKDNDLNLNKIYATTSSNNISSIKLLEHFHFKLDGRLREHYWINENKYDQLIYSLLKDQWIKR